MLGCIVRHAYVTGCSTEIYVNYFTLHQVYIYMFIPGQDSQSKQGGYSMHQLQGNKEFGCEKKGYLLKKSDG